LPDGWLGKLHAMQRGAAVASGEFLLLSDADTHWVSHAVDGALGDRPAGDRVRTAGAGGCRRRRC